MQNFDDPTSDSKYYKWGFFYSNKSDKRIVVPKRYGFGYSLNFAQPYVTITLILILLILFLTAYYH